MKKKTFKELYRPLFFCSESSVKKILNRLYNYYVKSGKSRKQSKFIVLSNLEYFTGNPYTTNEKRVLFLSNVLHTQSKKLGYVTFNMNNLINNLYEKI